MGPGAWTSSETKSAAPARSGWAGQATPARGGGGWSAPYSLSDFAALLWRERFLMLGVFLAVFIAACAFSMTMKKTYTAFSAVLVQLGQEYVYNPGVGDAGRGAAASSGQIIQSELSILNSTAVKERAIQKIGLGAIFPKLAKEYDAGGREQQRLIFDAAVRAVNDGLRVETAPETSVVHLSFSHESPAMAARVLNTLVEEYLLYRKAVLVGADSGVLNEQRGLFEARLAAADTAYQQFLVETGIGDFETEKASLAQVYGSLLNERYSIQAQLSEVQGRLGVTTRQASQALPEIGLYQDSDPTASNRLTQLRVERQDLLSRYRPESQPVREIDQKIGALQALIAQGGAAGVSASRTGPNPVFQSLSTEKNQLEAQAASLRSRQAAVNADLAQVAARRQRLTMLEPRHMELTREREVLSTNVRNLSAREQEGEAARAIALKGEDNIRVVERAYTPTKGASLKAPIIALGFLFGAFTAVCAALVRILLRRGFVTPEATARTMELPVLATAPLKRASA
jgi:uncharacterized protein involved in exopolysaccharide biosynthesis